MFQNRLGLFCSIEGKVLLKKVRLATLSSLRYVAAATLYADHRAEDGDNLAILNSLFLRLESLFRCRLYQGELALQYTFLSGIYLFVNSMILFLNRFQLSFTVRSKLAEKKVQKRT